MCLLRIYIFPKHFVHSISFQLPNTFMRLVKLFSFYRWGNWGTRLNKLFKDTQEVIKLGFKPIGLVSEPTCLGLDKDLGANGLSGRWFQEAQVRGGKVREGRRKVITWGGHHCRQQSQTQAVWRAEKAIPQNCSPRGAGTGELTP